MVIWLHHFSILSSIMLCILYCCKDLIFIFASILLKTGAYIWWYSVNAFLCFSFTSKVMHVTTSLERLETGRKSHMTVLWTLLLLGIFIFFCLFWLQIYWIIFSPVNIRFYLWAWRYAKPWTDLDTGSSYCLFFPYSPEHLVHSIPNSKDMRPDISVSINASLREANYVSGSASALFIGGFSVLEMGKVMI